MNKTRYADVVIANNIKRLCAEKNLTHSEVANVIGKERKSVFNYVNCVSIPSAVDIKKICSTYKISADELLGLSR